MENSSRSACVSGCIRTRNEAEKQRPENHRTIRGDARDDGCPCSASPFFYLYLPYLITPSRLKDVKDVNQTAPDGQTIRGRLQELSITTAEDIKSCANTCDTYSKKKLIVKILSGPLWEGKLLNFVGLFTQRKQDFMFALTVNTAVGVSDANIKLDNVEAMTREIDNK